MKIFWKGSCVKQIGDIQMLYCHKHIWVNSSHGEDREAQALRHNSAMDYMVAKKHLGICPADEFMELKPQQVTLNILTNVKAKCTQ